jgi:hypothetical protein
MIVGRVRPGARAQGDRAAMLLEEVAESLVNELLQFNHSVFGEVWSCVRQIGHASTAIPDLDRHVRALTDPHHRWHGRSSAQNFRGILGVPLYSLGVLNQFSGYEIALCASDR